MGIIELFGADVSEQDSSSSRLQESEPSAKIQDKNRFYIFLTCNNHLKKRMVVACQK